MRVYNEEHIFSELEFSSPYRYGSHHKNWELALIKEASSLGLTESSIKCKIKRFNRVKL